MRLSSRNSLSITMELGCHRSSFSLACSSCLKRRQNDVGSSTSEKELSFRVAVVLIVPVGLEILFAIGSAIADHLVREFRLKLAIHRRYTERRFLCIPYCYLQGITVRPVPCNYNVIQHVSALSRP